MYPQRQKVPYYVVSPTVFRSVLLQVGETLSRSVTAIKVKQKITASFCFAYNSKKFKIASLFLSFSNIKIEIKHLLKEKKKKEKERKP